MEQLKTDVHEEIVSMKIRVNTTLDKLEINVPKNTSHCANYIKCNSDCIFYEVDENKCNKCQLARARDNIENIMRFWKAESTGDEK